VGTADKLGDESLEVMSWDWTLSLPIYLLAKTSQQFTKQLALIKVYLHFNQSIKGCMFMHQLLKN